MPRIRDLLHRFRPAGAPGAAGAAGVPVDRAADLAAELAPLFADLAGTEQESADIREQGRRDAAEIRDRAAERAHAVVATTEQRVAAEHAAAVARARRRAEGESRDAQAAAQRDAAELLDRAKSRTPAYVDRVVRSVRELISDQQGGGVR